MLKKSINSIPLFDNHAQPIIANSVERENVKLDKNFFDSTIIKRESVSKIISNSSSKKDVGSIIKNIEALVNIKLNQYKDECVLITSKDELISYINKCNEVGLVAIDTETTSLDVMETTLVGFSLYTKGQKAAYIPVNHISYITLQKVKNQLYKDDIIECFNLLTAKIIMFNALFDMRVLYYTLGINVKIYWDTYILNKLTINGMSNLSASLKPSYSRVKGLKEPALSFDDYFKGITFDYVPINIGYIYAAMDAKITYELYEYQLQHYKTEEYEGLYNLFRKIEMPLLRVVFDMMNNGICFDKELNEKLLIEYENKLEECSKQVLDKISEYDELIDNYRRININNCKISNPISISSPTQLSILLYDILKLPSVSEKSPRGTGEKELDKLKNKVSFASDILKYREIDKLLTTYIRKMPSVVKKDGRVHAQFNPLGAVTGRFSSDSPNLQNIPTSGNIRRVFRATPGYYFVSCDYSSQEPRIVAHLSNDPVMIKAFKEGKDYYSFLGSIAYKIPYENCREFFPDGSVNKEGKKIRDKCKKAFLGLCYGMGFQTLAEQLGISPDEAQNVLNKVLAASPGLKKLLRDSIEFARNYGYVETLWGRRRYLNYIQYSPYEYSFTDKFVIPFDVMDFESECIDDTYKDDIMDKWDRKLNSCKSYIDRNKLIAKAKDEGIIITDNTGYVKEDERYSINTKVQGSAADMTKQSMINIYNDNRLRELGFRLLLTVHDELIGECPIDNIKLAVPLIEENMLKHTRDLRVPFKVDTEISECWYGESISI